MNAETATHERPAVEAEGEAMAKMRGAGEEGSHALGPPSPTSGSEFEGQCVVMKVPVYLVTARKPFCLKQITDM
jgi:hypothetical protein